MRPCTPIFVGTRAAGIRHQACTAPRRARREALANPQAPSHAAPRTATLHQRCKVATKSVLFFWTVHGPFSFRQDRKENGGCIAQLATQMNPRVQWDAPPGGIYGQTS